jgi:type IV fimbrial biogenesis protein FimT
MLDRQERRRVLMAAVPKAAAEGFTLTELMIAVAILGTLVLLAMPTFRQMLRNYEVRAAAESVVNGLQRARAEAVSRNTTVYFALGSGTSWTVDYVTKPVPTDPPLDSRASEEGSASATRTAFAADFATPATTITYNNLGQVVANADASQSLGVVVVTAPEASQTLHVAIGPGGSARTCDPDPNLPTTNVRKCLAGE